MRECATRVSAMYRNWLRSRQIRFIIGGIVFLLVFLLSSNNDNVVELQSLIFPRNWNVRDSGSNYESGIDTDEKLKSSHMTSWLQTQEQRRRAINKTCSYIDKKQLRTTMYALKGSRQYLLYDDCHKAIYCSIPKVAKTSWSKAWMLLSRMSFNVTGFSAQKVEEAFKDKTMKDIAKKEDLEYRFTNYKKIIVVRNPVERLMAVYLDLTKKAGISAGVLRAVKRTRHTATVADITWPEFVNYIISEGVIDHQQFLPFEEICHPCAIDYDFVVKLETFQVDSDNVVELIGGTESERVNLSPSENTIDSKKVQELWGLLSSVERKALRRKYYRDIEMFEYL